jgi:vancomycin aglycone glucosyltransferase
MRVLLSVNGSRGDIEQMAGLAVQLQSLGVEVRVCAPPDPEFIERIERAGAEFVPFGEPVRPKVTGKVPQTSASLAQRAADLVDLQFATLFEAAEGCDALRGP